MTGKRISKPNVIGLITDYVAQNPGTNIGQTSTALAPYYSMPYTQQTIKTMIARGLLRAIVSPINRYNLYVPDQQPDQEAK